MPPAFQAFIAVVGAYIIGSIDFAVVVGRMHGVDIHQVGSGNPGTANVMRTLGRGPAAMVLVGDTLKGVIAAALGMVVSGDPQSTLAVGAGLAAVVGHCFPLFHRFRGGKGVATALGAVLFIIPVGGLVLAAAWLIVVAISRISALGSLTMALAGVPVAIWQGLRGTTLIPLALMFLLVIVRHRSNIQRLLAGEEHTVTRN
ncbi:MAG: glycerol-3-phosphate 1-O-acyltransferase PlsY [Actinomycetes bacterium]